MQRFSLALLTKPERQSKVERLVFRESDLFDNFTGDLFRSGGVHVGAGVSSFNWKIRGRWGRVEEDCYRLFGG